jgi:hypothetical protein
VIAKTLVDLDLYRTDLGALVVGAAVFDDLIGWTLFGLVVGLFGHAEMTFGTALGEIAISFIGVAAALTLGRAVLWRILGWIDRGATDHGGVVAFVVCTALASAALTEWLGHGALMGAFMAGVAMGGTLATSPARLRDLMRLVAVVFAPIFFGSLGLRTDFAANFDLPLVATVLGIARGKLVGCSRPRALERPADARGLGGRRGHERAAPWRWRWRSSRCSTGSSRSGCSSPGRDGAGHLGARRAADEAADPPCTASGSRSRTCARPASCRGSLRATATR